MDLVDADGNFQRCLFCRAYRCRGAKLEMPVYTIRNSFRVSKSLRDFRQSIVPNAAIVAAIRLIRYPEYSTD